MRSPIAGKRANTRAGHLTYMQPSLFVKSIAVCYNGLRSRFARSISIVTAAGFGVAELRQDHEYFTGLDFAKLLRREVGNTLYSAIHAHTSRGEGRGEEVANAKTKDNERRGQRGRRRRRRMRRSRSPILLSGQLPAFSGSVSLLAQDGCHLPVRTVRNIL